jgi:hypothetical protein
LDDEKAVAWVALRNQHFIFAQAPRYTMAG